MAQDTINVRSVESNLIKWLDNQNKVSEGGIYTAIFVDAAEGKKIIGGTIRDAIKSLKKYYGHQGNLKSSDSKKIGIILSHLDEMDKAAKYKIFDRARNRLTQKSNPENNGRVGHMKPEIRLIPESDLRMYGKSGVVRIDDIAALAIEKSKQK